jgi:hypothetical protein
MLSRSNWKGEGLQIGSMLAYYSLNEINDNLTQ